MPLLAIGMPRRQVPLGTMRHAPPAAAPATTLAATKSTAKQGANGSSSIDPWTASKGAKYNAKSDLVYTCPNEAAEASAAALVLPSATPLIPAARLHLKIPHSNLQPAHLITVRIHKTYSTLRNGIENRPSPALGNGEARLRRSNRRSANGIALGARRGTEGEEEMKCSEMDRSRQSAARKAGRRRRRGARVSGQHRRGGTARPRRWPRPGLPARGAIASGPSKS